MPVFLLKVTSESLATQVSVLTIQSIVGLDYIVTIRIQNRGPRVNNTFKLAHSFRRQLRSKILLSITGHMRCTFKIERRYGTVTTETIRNLLESDIHNKNILVASFSRNSLIKCFICRIPHSAYSNFAHQCGHPPFWIYFQLPAYFLTYGSILCFCSDN